MTPIGALVVGGVALGAAAVVYALTANLERHPEYPGLATEAMRFVGAFVATCGAVFGAVLLCRAFVGALRAVLG